MKLFQKDKENAKQAVAEYKHISRKEDLNEAYYLLHMDYYHIINYIWVVWVLVKMWGGKTRLRCFIKAKK